MLMNVTHKKNQCISSQTLNIHHAYTTCKDSILKSRGRPEYSLLPLALLVERNNQKTDPHCMSIF